MDMASREHGERMVSAGRNIPSLFLSLFLYFKRTPNWIFMSGDRFVWNRSSLGLSRVKCDPLN